MEDNKEDELYRNFINAQYEYFKYIEPERIANIEQRLRGKVKNPFHWLSLLEEKNTCNQMLSSGHVDKDKIKATYKDLMIIFHPDKNSDRNQEATVFFQFLQTLFDESKEDILNDIMLAEDKWSKMREITNSKSIYFKKKYCDQVRLSKWFNWCVQYEEQYVTNEELEEIIKKESEKIRLENEKLEKENKMLRDILENNIRIQGNN